MASPDVLETVTLLGAVVALARPAHLVGDLAAKRVEALREAAREVEEELRGRLRVRHGAMRRRVVATEHESHQVGQLVAAGIGVELVAELEGVEHGRWLPAAVGRQVAEHERDVEPGVVGDDRGLPHPVDEAAEHLGSGRRVGDVIGLDAVHLVPDDRAARVHQRLECIDDLAIAHAQRGDVDDVAVLGLHGGRLEVEHDELVAALGEQLPELDDRRGLGSDERDLLRLAGRGDELVLELDRLLELAVAVGDGIGHDRLRQDLGAGLHHHDRLAGAGHDEVELALGELAVGRIGDELAADATDADRADRAHEGDLADAERRRGAVERQDVRIVLLVGREDRQDDLDVVVVALREERAKRPVGEAHRQDGGLRRARLALDESAGDLARGVHPLLVVHGEREEVGPFAGLLGGDRGRQDDGVAIPDDDRAVCLLGELAGLHAEDLAADLGFVLD